MMYIGPLKRYLCLPFAFVCILFAAGSGFHWALTQPISSFSDGKIQEKLQEDLRVSDERGAHVPNVLHTTTSEPFEADIMPSQRLAAAAPHTDVGIADAVVSGTTPDDPSKKPTEDTTNLATISDNVAELVSLGCFIIISACMLQFVVSKVNDKIPISIVCFIFGMGTYGFSILFEGQEHLGPLCRSIHMLRHIDSSILYYIALPMLLYEATQDINWYTFCNFIVGGISLAIIGVVLQVMLLGVLFHYILNIASNGYITISFLLASILSSTDPVAVLSVLGGVNAQPKLAAIFHCESLINDGSSVLLFQFFYLLLVGQAQSYIHYVYLFAKLLVLGPLLGLLVGVAVTVWISLFRKHHITQCLGVVTTGHLVYFLAEHTMNLSGPLAIVCYGIFIKAYGLIALDREALEKHDHFVEGVCLIANSVVFVISGALTVGMLRAQLQTPDVWAHVGRLLLTYLLINLARAIMILVFSPLLTYIGYSLNYKEMLLLLWGGLRGAMVLVLGLRLENDTNTPDQVSDLLAFYIGGNVMIILLLQGLTFELLYRLLNPYPMKPFRRVYLVKVMNMIDYQFNHDIEWMKEHWLFENTDAVTQGYKLVPKMGTIRWNATGNIEFDVPHVDDNLEGCKQLPTVEYTEENTMNQMKRCDTVYSCSSNLSAEGDSVKRELPPQTNLGDPEKGDDTYMYKSNQLSDDEFSYNMPVLTYGILKTNSTGDNMGYNPTMYLRLLEHAFTMDVDTSQEHASTQRIPLKSQNTNDNKSDYSQIPVVTPPERSDTDATINVESLYKRPIHRRSSSMSLVPRIYSDDRLFESTYKRGRYVSSTLPTASPARRVLRKEREAELYIMIFNSFSDIYNKLYQTELIDGGALLLLQKALDVASDFALNKLKKRSIAAWAGVLGEMVVDKNSSYNFDNVEEMGGFEFEWFVLHSMVEKRMERIDGCFGSHFLNFSQHNDVQSVLELLVAYIDVRQHLLKRGGRDLELLLEEKLLASYKRPILRAKMYITTLSHRWPQHVRHGLVTMTTCVMLRIKRDIVNEQSTHGLLLEEDRKKVVELLEEQLFRVATKHNRINVFKRLFRKLFHQITCHFAQRTPKNNNLK